MDLKRMFQRRPKALDGAPEDGPESALGEALTVNEQVRRKQMMLLAGGGAIALLMGSMYIFDDVEKPEGEVASETKSALVPFLMYGFAERRDLFQEAGIHPAVAAQPLMLDTVGPKLRPLLAKPPRRR